MFKEFNIEDNILFQIGTKDKSNSMRYHPDPRTPNINYTPYWKVWASSSFFLILQKCGLPVLWIDFNQFDYSTPVMFSSIGKPWQTINMDGGGEDYTYTVLFTFQRRRHFWKWKAVLSIIILCENVRQNCPFLYVCIN